MKKTLALFLCALMLLSFFAACGSEESDTTLQETQTKTTQTSSPTPTPAPTLTPTPTETPMPTQTPSAPTDGEYTLPAEKGTNQLVLYWKNQSGDYSKCDIWIWYAGENGHGYPFHKCAYGAKVVLNVPEEITEVGFIVRKNCSDPGGTSWGDAEKDYDGDRYAIITGDLTEIYLKAGDSGQYFSGDGGKTLYEKKSVAIAEIISLNSIRFTVSPAAKFATADAIRVLDGERQLEIVDVSSIHDETAVRTIILGEELDMCKNYELKLDGYDAKTVVPTEVFDSPGFIDRYVYTGDDLGAVINGGKTTFKVWAPTAGKVVLNLYAEGQGGEKIGSYDMTPGDKGVWSYTADCGHGTYYTYTVTTAAGTQEAVDPYAKAVGVNGDRGMVVDLVKTDPAGFADDTYYQDVNAYNEAVIWEVHVRDFSNKLEGSNYRGKYLAFTETGLKNSSGFPVGVDYLKELGVTHVHFQPIFDFATVDESIDTPQYNWGYDPKNYNVPEGSYATDPYHGEVRINELKQMVMALHNNGMGVIMDVVYNHTYDANSNFNKIVPYYYYRLNENGEMSNGSGCGNETASERAMFRKYMVDSVSYWAREYHVDGFRFDLMGLHDLETMQQVEAAVHAINPKAILYGEGWTGGATPLPSDRQANQANISRIKPTGDAIGSVAVFNDVMRDGLKESVFDTGDKGYINGAPTTVNANKVAFGIAGGARRPIASSWGVDSDMVINYMSCHDNHTLWDKLLLSNPDAGDDERIAMYRLGASLVLLSKGTPFLLAGEEMMRSKQGEHNSYNSSDEINNLDWSVLSPGSAAEEMFSWYKSLIALRKSHPFLTSAIQSVEITGDGLITARYIEEGKIAAFFIVNPHAGPVDYQIPAELGETLNEEGQPVSWISGTVSIPQRSLLLVIAPDHEETQ